KLLPDRSYTYTMKKLALLLLAPALLALTGWATNREPAFSRTRWLEEQKAWGARLSENLVPENPRRLKAFLNAVAGTRPPRGGIPKGVVRVSADVLDPIGGPAPPGTRTEPVPPVRPENPQHLLARYQEAPCPGGG